MLNFLRAGPGQHLSANGSEITDTSEITDSISAKQFPNAFRVAGLKHVADNLLGLQAMHCWQPVLASLRCLETLLKKPMYRERFQHSCIGPGHPQSKLFQTWSTSLKNLRWQSVVAFCCELENVERPLRAFWNKSLFSNEEPQAPANALPVQSQSLGDWLGCYTRVAQA